MAKYIFVTGGVVSGLGKGIVAASLGRLLKLRGYKISTLKCDPYMNIDPGTMNPTQHGEVYVTADGAETDLDLGHYERMINENLTKYSNLTSGKVYLSVINKERNGEYLGQTVQIIPHVTNEIKDFIIKNQEYSNADIVICEIGGTIGDIESQPFLEAIRQFSNDVGRENCAYIHVCLVPFISGSNEYKSKPVQHSVKELQSLGIHPDVVVMRSDGDPGEAIREKIALFCSIKKENVILNETIESLYEAPLMLNKNGLDNAICNILNLKKKVNLKTWKDLVKSIYACKKVTKIAIVGKYVTLHDSYLSVIEALNHAGFYNNTKIEIKWVDSEELTDVNVAEKLASVSGILVPGGFGNRGIEGMIIACKYARLNNIPYLGICLGLQIAAIEFARNVVGIKDATSSEFSKEGTAVIDLMLEQKDVSKIGGSMRLGNCKCSSVFGSIIRKAYDSDEFVERHRHRYEFNPLFKEEFSKNGLDFVAFSQNGLVVEAIEIKENDFFLGVQYHPEFTSRPNHANPVFIEFVKYSKNKSKEKGVNKNE